MPVAVVATRIEEVSVSARIHPASQEPSGCFAKVAPPAEGMSRPGDRAGKEAPVQLAGHPR
jgi:hypothetical protein